MAGWAAGVFTRARNWVTDKNGAINPQAALFDQEDDNFAAGLNNCVTKDGLNKPSASMDWNAQKLTNIAAGTAALPSVNFNGNLTTGFYSDTTSQIGIALAGVTAGQIAQGVYTGTLTGCSTSPTMGISYQRVGNLVILNISVGNTGTSNANTMTITGAPAVIRPAVSTGFITIGGDITNNGADDNSVVHFVTMNSVGTLTFYRAGSNPGTWTASGTKGIGLLGMTIAYLLT